jgi:hypothetical protein
VTRVASLLHMYGEQGVLKRGDVPRADVRRRVESGGLRAAVSGLRSALERA